MRMSTSAHLLDFQLQCDFKIVLLKLQYNNRHIEKSFNEYFFKLKINLRRGHILWQCGERNSFNRTHMCKNEILVYVLTTRSK